MYVLGVAVCVTNIKTYRYRSKIPTPT